MQRFLVTTPLAARYLGQLTSSTFSFLQDNKWSVYELWAWLRERGQDPEPFWSRVKDVVIKTILCGHKNIDNMVKKDVGSFYNNYNLLGLDIFIDTEYK